MSVKINENPEHGISLDYIKAVTAVNKQNAARKGGISLEYIANVTGGKGAGIKPSDTEPLTADLETIGDTMPKPSVSVPEKSKINDIPENKRPVVYEGPKTNTMKSADITASTDVKNVLQGDNTTTKQPTKARNTVAPFMRTATVESTMPTLPSTETVTPQKPETVVEVSPDHRIGRPTVYDPDAEQIALAENATELIERKKTSNSFDSIKWRIENNTFDVNQAVDWNADPNGTAVSDSLKYLIEVESKKQIEYENIRDEAEKKNLREYKNIENDISVLGYQMNKLGKSYDEAYEQMIFTCYPDGNSPYASAQDFRDKCTQYIQAMEQLNEYTENVEYQKSFIKELEMFYDYRVESEEYQRLDYAAAPIERNAYTADNFYEIAQQGMICEEEYKDFSDLRKELTYKSKLVIDTVSRLQSRDRVLESLRSEVKKFEDSLSNPIAYIEAYRDKIQAESGWNAWTDGESLLLSGIYTPEYFYFTEAEALIYSYYAETEGREKADEYMQSIMHRLTARREQFLAENNGMEKVAAWAEENDFLAGAASVLSNLPGGLFSFGGMISGETNPYSPAFYLTHLTQALREGAMRDDSEIEAVAANSLMSAGDNLLRLAFGPLGEYIMYAGAMGTSYSDALQRGCSQDEAVAYAVVSGSIEFLTEKLPFEKLLSRVNSGAIFTQEEWVKEIGKILLEHGVPELGGEAINSYASTLMEIQILGDKSSYNQYIEYMVFEQGMSYEEAVKDANHHFFIVQPIEDAVVGFTSAGLLSTGVTGVNTAVDSANKKQIKNFKTGAELAQKIIDGEQLTVTEKKDLLKKTATNPARKTFETLTGISLKGDFSTVSAKLDAEANEYAKKKQEGVDLAKTQTADVQSDIGNQPQQITELDLDESTNFSGTSQQSDTDTAPLAIPSQIEQSAPQDISPTNVQNIANIHKGANYADKLENARIKQEEQYGSTFVRDAGRAADILSKGTRASGSASTMHKGGVTLNIGNGQSITSISIDDISGYSSKNRWGISRNVSSQVSAIEASANRTNLDVYFYDGSVTPVRGSNGKLANGFHHKGPDGEYIAIDITSDAPLLYVFGHEMFHAMGKESERKLTKYLSEYLGEELSVEQAADKLGECLCDPAFCEYLVNKNRSLAQKVLSFIKNFIAKLKGQDIQELNTAQKTLANALNAYIKKGNTNQHTGRSNEYMTVADTFARDIDAWDKGGRKTGGYIRVGTTSEVLQGVGMKSQELYFDKSKIKKILNTHEHMNIDLIKQVPHMLEDPVAVFESTAHPNRVVAVGELYDTEGKPVIAAVEMDLKGTNKSEISKIISTYGKKNLGTTFENDRLLYLNPDIERTTAWFRLLRLQLPAEGINRSGYIGMITPAERDVNGNFSIGSDTKFGTAMGDALRKAGVIDEDSNNSFMFAGRNAKNANVSALETAKQMEGDGVDSETIRKETGWHKGYEGKWRFEISDSEIKLKKQGNMPDYSTLGELIDHKKLFAAYPEMKKIKVLFSEKCEGFMGMYVREYNAIILDKSLKEKEADLMRLVVHEIQHAVQDIEGFANGASPEYWRKRIKEGFDTRPKYEQDKTKKLLEEYSRIERDNPDFIREMIELEGMKPTIGRGRADPRTGKKIEEDPMEWKHYDEKMDSIEAEYGNLMWNFIDLMDEISLSENRGKRNGKQLYDDTAGEVEARNTAERLNLDSEQRKNTRPDIDRKDVVFADGSEYLSVKSEDEAFENQIRPYSEFRERLISSDKNNVIARTKEDVVAFVRESFLDKQSKKSLHLGAVSSELMERIYNEVENLPENKRDSLFKSNREYSLEIGQEDIRHLVQDKKGLSVEDVINYVLNMPTVVNDFDQVHYTEYRKGNNIMNGLLFRKQLSDGKYIVLEIVSKKSSEMQTHNIYMDKADYKKKKKASNSMSVQKARDLTSETLEDSPSVTSIPNSTDDVNSFMSRSSRTDIGDGVSVKKVDAQVRSSRNKKFAAEYELINRIAKRTRTKVQYVSSIMQDGKTLDGGCYYHRASGTLYLNVNSDKALSGAFYRGLLHHLAENDAQFVQTAYNYVREYGKKAGWKGDVITQINEALTGRTETTRSHEAFEEVFADKVAEMFENENFMRYVSRKNMTFLQKLWENIKSFIIRSLGGAYTPPADVINAKTAEEIIGKMSDIQVLVADALDRQGHDRTRAAKQTAKEIGKSARKLNGKYVELNGGNYAEREWQEYEIDRVEYKDVTAEALRSTLSKMPDAILRTLAREMKYDFESTTATGRKVEFAKNVLSKLNPEDIVSIPNIAYRDVDVSPLTSKAQKPNISALKKTGNVKTVRRYGYQNVADGVMIYVTDPSKLPLSNAHADNLAAGRSLAGALGFERIGYYTGDIRNVNGKEVKTESRAVIGKDGTLYINLNADSPYTAIIGAAWFENLRKTNTQTATALVKAYDRYRKLTRSKADISQWIGKQLTGTQSTALFTGNKLFTEELSNLMHMNASEMLGVIEADPQFSSLIARGDMTLAERTLDSIKGFFTKFGDTVARMTGNTDRRAADALTIAQKNILIAMRDAPIDGARAIRTEAERAAEYRRIQNIEREIERIDRLEAERERAAQQERADRRRDYYEELDRQEAEKKQARDRRKWNWGDVPDGEGGDLNSFMSRHVDNENVESYNQSRGDNNGRRKGEVFRETREAFESRARKEGLRGLKEIKPGITCRFGIPTSGLLYQKRKDAERELRRLGINGIVFSDSIMFNNGTATTIASGASMTINREIVAIGITNDDDYMEHIGHEAFHLWDNTESKKNYYDAVIGNVVLDKFFYDLFEHINKEYFKGKFDAYSEADGALFNEELVAYISGMIHSGQDISGLCENPNVVIETWNKLVDEHVINESENNSFMSRKEADSAALGKGLDDLFADNAEAVKKAIGRFEQSQAAEAESQTPKSETEPAPIINEDSEVRSKYQELRDKFGTIPQGEDVNSRGDVGVPRRTQKNNRVRQGIRTFAEAKATPDEVVGELEREIVNGTFSYTPLSDKVANNYAREMIEADPEEALKEWDAVVRGTKPATKKQIALAENLIMEAAALGDTDTAVRLIAEVAAEGTRAGQAVQAFRMVKKLSPMGQLYSLQRAIDKLNRENENRGTKIELPNERLEDYAKTVTELENLQRRIAELEKAVSTSDTKGKLHDEIDSLRDEVEQKKKAAERQLDDLKDDVADQMPKSWTEKLNAWRYLSMLGNPRTHIRNILGNAVFAPTVTLKSKLAAVMEAGVKKINPKFERSQSLTASKAIKEFAARDAVENLEQLANGGKYNAGDELRERQKVFSERNIVGRAINKASEFNSALLEVEDAMFLCKRYTYALAHYCAANKWNVAHLKAIPADLQRAREFAFREAQRATYRDMNAFSHFLSQASNKLRDGKGFSRIAYWAMEGAMPFKKTPANIIKRGIEYSPIGLLGSLSTDILRLKRGEMTGAEYINNLAAGMTGTMVLGLGYLLASLGVLRGRNKDDEDEFEKLRGAQEWSLIIGDVSYTIDWLAPMSLPLFVGVELYDQTANSNDKMDMQDILDSLTAISEPIFSLSMMDGVQSLLQSYSSEGAISDMFISALQSYVGQMTPTILGQLARTLDDTSRNAYYNDKTSWWSNTVMQPIRSAMAKIPGLEEQLPARVDAWGRTTEGDTTIGERFVQNFLSPGYWSVDKTTPVDEEIQKIYDEIGDNSILPDTAPKQFTCNGETYYLSSEEYVTFAIDRGQTAYAIIDELINNKTYKSLSAEDRADAISKAYDIALDYAKGNTESGFNAESNKAIKAFNENGIEYSDYILFSVLCTGNSQADAYKALNKMRYLTDAERSAIWNTKGWKTTYVDYKAEH